jgi:hypothetical protein
MYNFNQFITESSKEGKNLHLEHLEDEVLNRGVVGARQAINFLQSLRDMLAGHSDSKINITTKWDGAPAIFCGINPENGKFFVGTKGVFSKSAKLNYTDDDIDKTHPGEGLNKKLKIALRYLPKLDIRGVIQGDMMFTHEDLQNQTIDGEEYVTFQPNTIVYAIPKDSNLARSIVSAKMGIVFHTSYTGKTMEDMKASFNIDIGKMSTTKDVWFRDASFVDASGTATFTKDETQSITSILSQAGQVFRSIDSKFLNSIALREKLLVDIKAFNNSKVRAGEEIHNTTSHTNELIKRLEDKYNANILDAKKEETRQLRISEKNHLLGDLLKNRQNLKLIFDLMNLLVEAKLMVVRKLQSVKGVGTFIRTDNGFKVTSPEGFVAVDRLKGNAMKLIDRMEFSMQNFNAQKQWTK